MATYWVSSKKMTISIDVNSENVITATPPIAQVFKGQPLDNLIKWMKKQGGFKIKKMTNIDV